MARTRAIAAAPGQTQSTVNFTAQEETDKDADEAAFVIEAAVTKIADERAWRDGELAATDYFGVSDQTMTAAMTTYRQELRDMPTLTGFPDTHTRPTLV